MRIFWGCLACAFGCGVVVERDGEEWGVGMLGWYGVFFGKGIGVRGTGWNCDGGMMGMCCSGSQIVVVRRLVGSGGLKEAKTGSEGNR